MRATPLFASDHLANQFLGRQGSQRFSAMLKFLKDTAGNSAFAAARGIPFELYAHIRLQKGGQDSQLAKLRGRTVGGSFDSTICGNP